LAGRPLGPALPRDPNFAPYLGSAERARLRQRFHSTLCCGEGLAAAQAEVRAALELGLPVLAGSDAPVPGTTHGASLHQELAQLVEAGLSPTQALMAATSAPADAFHLGDRGRIAPGLRADLLLVEGDPTREIGDTGRVVAVWREGAPFDRQAYRERLEPESLGGKP
jgi:adenine deaminase